MTLPNTDWRLENRHRQDPCPPSVISCPGVLTQQLKNNTTAVLKDLKIEWPQNCMASPCSSQNWIILTVSQPRSPDTSHLTSIFYNSGKFYFASLHNIPNSLSYHLSSFLFQKRRKQKSTFKHTDTLKDGKEDESILPLFSKRGHLPPEHLPVYHREGRTAGTSTGSWNDNDISEMKVLEGSGNYLRALLFPPHMPLVPTPSPLCSTVYFRKKLGVTVPSSEDEFSKLHITRRTATAAIRHHPDLTALKLAVGAKQLLW